MNCPSCHEFDGVLQPLRPCVCGNYPNPHWFCTRCGAERRMSAMQRAAHEAAQQLLQGQQARIIQQPSIKEESAPIASWHKVTLIVPREEGESDPSKWDWTDLVGCIEQVRIVSCESTQTPEKEKEDATV